MDLKTEQYINRLEDFKKVIETVDDEEVKSYLVKLFCIRTAGLIEVFVKTRISEYINRKVPKEVNRFINSKFKDITNLKPTKLTEVLTSFSVQWADDFSNYLKDHEQEKNSLDSIITQRHNIAHGQPSTITYASMVQYYEDVKKVVSYLHNIIK